MLGTLIDLLVSGLRKLVHRFIGSKVHTKLCCVSALPNLLLEAVHVPGTKCVMLTSRDVS